MDAIIQWLMEGDPAIRWQVQRDLLDAPEVEWQAERAKTRETGWGARLLAHQDPDGRWGGGTYGPKWTSTTYTLLMLIDIGIPPEDAGARQGAAHVIDVLLGPVRDAAFDRRLADCDRCVVGMILEIAVYFGIQDDRIAAIVDNLLGERMPDGGWNCRRLRRPRPHHSSFHTTFNVLDGLRGYLNRGGVYRQEDIIAGEQEALELLLAHRLFKSHQTGVVINSKFTLLSFPYRWHYDALRGLDYFAGIHPPHDPRFQDAIDLLLERRRPDGTWPTQNKYSGKVFFDLERVGGPSRWNTLRALRVLRWWDS